MKSLYQIASRWDGKAVEYENGKPSSRKEDIDAAIYFVAHTDGISGKAAEGIGHGLRAMATHYELFAPSARLILEYLERHGLGRPSPRLVTACAIAAEGEPGNPLAIAACHHMAKILDDPKNIKAIKPYLRLECEGSILDNLGIETRRGRSAIPASLMLIVSDRNDGPKIPMRHKQGYLEYIQSLAQHTGMKDIVTRADEVRKMLELRAKIPRRHQTGSGVFYRPPI